MDVMIHLDMFVLKFYFVITMKAELRLLLWQPTSSSTGHAKKKKNYGQRSSIKCNYDFVSYQRPVSVDHLFHFYNSFYF